MYERKRQKIVILVSGSVGLIFPCHLTENYYMFRICTLFYQDN